MKKHKTTFIMTLFFFIGLLTLLYPTLSNYYNEKMQVKTIYNYENILNDTNKIDFANLEDEEADPAMGEYTGAGTIFGATGGVMEAALRSAKDFVEVTDLDKIDYREVRGLEGIKEATVNIGGNDYNVAVINGAANVFKFMESDALSKKQYHFIEVMACPGGCVNGGGQPIKSSKVRREVDVRGLRANVLYDIDEKSTIRKSHENPVIDKLYKEYMKGNYGCEKAHHLLHTSYKAREKYDI